MDCCGACCLLCQCSCPALQVLRLPSKSSALQYPSNAARGYCSHMLTAREGFPATWVPTCLCHIRHFPCTLEAGQIGLEHQQGKHPAAIQFHAWAPSASLQAALRKEHAATCWHHILTFALRLSLTSVCQSTQTASSISSSISVLRLLDPPALTCRL